MTQRIYKSGVNGKVGGCEGFTWLRLEYQQARVSAFDRDK